MQMSVRDDPGARRNRGGGGIWVINILTSMLIGVLSLYVFRASDTRAEARAVLEVVGALPGQIAGTPAVAADRGD